MGRTDKQGLPIGAALAVGLNASTETTAAIATRVGLGRTTVWRVRAGKVSFVSAATATKLAEYLPQGHPLRTGLRCIDLEKADK